MTRYPRAVVENNELKMYVQRRHLEVFVFGGVAILWGLIYTFFSTLEKAQVRTSILGSLSAVAIIIGIYGTARAVHYARLLWQPLVYRFDRSSGNFFLENERICKMTDILEVVVIRVVNVKGGANTFRIILRLISGKKLDMHWTNGDLPDVSEAAAYMAHSLNIPYFEDI